MLVQNEHVYTLPKRVLPHVPSSRDHETLSPGASISWGQLTVRAVMVLVSALAVATVVTVGGEQQERWASSSGMVTSWSEGSISAPPF